MSGPIAQRTLVKSPPELWAELSDGAALAKHLGEFGEIRITRLEPETVVAWEGERANGTVTLASAGWGTKVTLTASAIEATEPDPPRETIEPDGRADGVLEASSEPEAEQPKLTLLGRLKRWLTPGGNAAMWQLSDEPSAGPSDTPPVAPAPAMPIRLEPPAAEPETEPEPPAAAEHSRQRSRKRRSSTC